MDIQVNYEGEKALMKVDGMINGDGAYIFMEKLNEIKETDVQLLEIDFSECRSISSTGIGKLLIFYKDFMQNDREVKIVKCSENIYQLFDKIRLNQLIEINM